MNGNWSNPATWGGTLPMGTGNVTINHVVTLDMNYLHVSGTVTVSVSASLTGDSPLRLFSLNYPSGTAELINDGTISVARIPFTGGTVLNSGTIVADSLLVIAKIDNEPGAIIDADQLRISTGGRITNNGNILAQNLLNVDSLLNSGNIECTNFTNSKVLRNTGSGTMTITHDFANDDTLASPADCDNSGFIVIMNNWYNGDQVSGSGRFCILNNTWNAGTMSGTFDFCDQTGGFIDLNTGTLGSSITFCAFACGLHTDRTLTGTEVSFFPNPATDILQWKVQDSNPVVKVRLLSLAGNVASAWQQVPSGTSTYTLPGLPDGLYLLEYSRKDGQIGRQLLTILQ